MSMPSPRRLGADPGDQVPFAKYAKAAESLLKPLIGGPARWPVARLSLSGSTCW